MNYLHSEFSQNLKDLKLKIRNSSTNTDVVAAEEQWFNFNRMTWFAALLLYRTSNWRPVESNPILNRLRLITVCWQSVTIYTLDSSYLPICLRVIVSCPSQTVVLWRQVALNLVTCVIKLGALIQPPFSPPLAVFTLWLRFADEVPSPFIEIAEYKLTPNNHINCVADYLSIFLTSMFLTLKVFHFFGQSILF